MAGVGAPALTVAQVAGGASIRDRVLSEPGVPPQRRKQLESRPERAPSLDLDTPISSIPVFYQATQVARAEALAALAGVSDAGRITLVEREIRIEQLEPATLDQLRLDGTLTPSEAVALQRVATAHRLVDERDDVVVRLASAIPTSLVTLDWPATLKGLPPPPGLSLDAWAELLRRKAANAWPAEAVARGVPALAAPLATHPELLTVDLSPGSVPPTGLSTAELAQLKEVRRVLAVTGDTSDGLALLRAGYGSAASLTSAGAVSARAQLPIARARELVAAAGQVSHAVCGAAGALLDVWTHPSRPSMRSWLATVPGYDALFGLRSPCDCEECCSVLGPAAYFVDLMSFVDEHVSQVWFASGSHPLALKARRPDLWTLALSCDNTDTLVPTLQIVAEVLENAVLTGIGSTVDPSDRAAVEQEVYERVLPRAVDGFAQPVTLALDEVRTLVGAFGHDLDEVARAVRLGPSELGRVSLGVSAVEFAILTRPADDLGFLRRVYGLPFAGDPIAPVDLIDFLEPMGVDRETFVTLVATHFVDRPGDRMVLRAEKSTPDSVQNDVERVDGLSVANLDRLHRFTRLWRAGSWSIEELDLLLGSFVEAELADGVDAAAIAVLAEVRRLQRGRGLSLEEAVLALAPIPVAPTEPDGAYLDRRFNLDRFVEVGGALPSSRTYQLPAFGTSSQAEHDSDHARLLAGLGLDDGGLEALVLALAGPLGIEPGGATEVERSFALDRNNLTLLARHAALAQRLGRTVPDLFTVLALDGRAAVDGLEALRSALARHDQVAAYAAPLADLAFAAGLTTEGDDAALAVAVIANLVEVLPFAATILVGVGLTESQSLEVLTSTPGIVPFADGFRLDASFDPDAAVVLPAGSTADPAAAHQTLLEHHASRLLRTALPAILGVDAERLDGLLALLALELGSLHGSLVGDPGPLGTAIGRLRRWLPLIADSSVFDATTLAAIAAEPALVGLTAPTVPNRAAIDTVEAYRQLRRSLPTTATADDLHLVLRAFDPTRGYEGVDRLALATVLGCAEGVAAAVVSVVPVGPDARTALAWVRAAQALAQDLGVGASVLRQAVSPQVAALTSAATALVAALRARHPEEADWTAAWDPLGDALLNRKRDGLVAWLVNTGRAPFDEPDDLYDYYLLDVAVDGCARTSRLVAALSSLQLYVQRVTLDLEQSPPGEPNGVAVPPDAIPADEWSWRRAYRLWQANRQVFLFPENWLLPEVRDDRTPLFRALEDELLQGDLSEAAVTAAYARYLKGFDALARLRISGACKERDDADRHDVLHLFGATSSDPPQHYYRRIDDLEASVANADRAPVWGPWEELPVDIPVRAVSPIVHRGRLRVFWVTSTTRSDTSFVGGSSTWTGYRHEVRVWFVERDADGSWTRPQAVDLGTEPFEPGLEGVVVDPLVYFGFRTEDGTIVSDNGPTTGHGALQVGPQERYRLRGVGWDRVQPFALTDRGDLCLRAADFQVVAPLDPYRLGLGARMMDPVSHGVDRGVPHTPPDAGVLLALFGGWGFPAARVVWSAPSGSGRRIAWGPPGVPLFENETWALLASRREHVEWYEDPRATLDPTPWWDPAVTDALRAVQVDNPILDLTGDGDLLPITGSPQDVVLTVGAESFLLLEGARPDGQYQLHRLFTSVGTVLAETLFTEGLARLLSLATQQSVNESPAPFTVHPGTVDRTGAGALDFDGPAGVYLRELYLHGPMLVARALRERSRYEDARTWFHLLFDPTAGASGTSPTDRPWQYREFREIDEEALRDQLSNEVALDQYRSDPFNPHAIARVRVSAYQKAVVQQYADNLIAWGDSLFVQDTTESVNEATLLYRMAQDVLGPRPVVVGDCGELAGEGSYAELAPGIEGDPELLLELEASVTRPKLVPFGPPETRAAGFRLAQRTYRAAGGRAARPAGPLPGVDLGWTGLVLGSLRSATPSVPDLGPLAPPMGVGFPRSLRTMLQPVFCFPDNDALTALRDLADDRLFKIRHCMNLDGVVRQLALFAPPIDPGLLVRATAAGLDLGSVVAATAGAVPAYRFRPLLDRARAYVGQLQSFGSALYAALERRDSESLSTLRVVHQRNQLALTTRMRDQEVRAAELGVTALERRQDVYQAQRDFYAGLSAGGLSKSETGQQQNSTSAATAQALAIVSDIGAAIAFLFPNAGAPTAMTYGGREAGASFQAWGAVGHGISSVASLNAANHGLQAGFDRRGEQWTFQRDSADRELAALAPQLEAARIRLEIAQRAIEVHEATLTQTDEVLALLESRFTDQELLEWRARELQSVYRGAWGMALTFARMAEQAFHYERDDDAIFVDGTGWDPSRAGLLAGERLALQLGAMESRYVESHARRQEVSLGLSLAQLDPVALVSLRETASCELTVGELAFDLFYPGQYRRRIRSVRLTIPCVTGPFTNVSAKLTLLESWIREEPAPGPAGLAAVPVRGTRSVAMSSAQGDAGVLDTAVGSERYLPFEGAGAVSRWRIELPSRFRPFDYRTITDVMITVAYEADDDGVLREAVEADTGTLMDALTAGSLVRVLSLRQDASAVFQRLAYGPPGTDVLLALDDRQFPLFLQGQTLVATSAAVALSLAPGTSADGVVLGLNGKDLTGFAADPALGGLPATTATAAFGTTVKATHRISVKDPAGLGASGGPMVVDLDRVRDIFLLVTFRVG
ncbi:MAG: neuraminidase-like domain-containing protein [Myxococcota bacterium]